MLMEHLQVILAVLVLLIGGSLLYTLKQRKTKRRMNRRCEPTVHETEVSEPVMTEAESESRESIVLMLYVIAPQGRLFASYDLLQSITNLGFHYGAMNIFHRHEEFEGKGSVLFSLASAVTPGTFNLDNIGAFSTPGLVLFMEADQHQHPETVFKMMLESGCQLADELGGVLHESPRVPWSSESYHQYLGRLTQYA